jgi:hypothetical protein
MLDGGRHMDCACYYLRHGSENRTTLGVLQYFMDRQKLLDTIAWELNLDDDRHSLWTDVLLSQPGLSQSLAIGNWLSHRIKIGDESWRFLAAHGNEIVREWAAILVGLTDTITFARKLAWIKPFADDEHFGLRDIACLALRKDVIRDPGSAIRCLVPWTGSRNERLRRFSVEVTRPCGSWSLHIQQLVDMPEFGLPILEPMRADESNYVQDSVCNWLNDASKSNPEWVQATTARWFADGQGS